WRRRRRRRSASWCPPGRRTPTRPPSAAAPPGPTCGPTSGRRPRVVPAHVDHRVLVRLGEAGVLPGVALALVEASLYGVVAEPALAVLLRVGAVAVVLHEAGELAA